MMTAVTSACPMAVAHQLRTRVHAVPISMHSFNPFPCQPLLHGATSCLLALTLPHQPRALAAVMRSSCAARRDATVAQSVICGMLRCCPTAVSKRPACCSAG